MATRKLESQLYERNLVDGEAFVVVGGEAIVPAKGISSAALILETYRRRRRLRELAVHLLQGPAGKGTISMVSQKRQEATITLADGSTQEVSVEVAVSGRLWTIRGAFRGWLGVVQLDDQSGRYVPVLNARTGRHLDPKETRDDAIAALIEARIKATGRPVA